MKLNPGDRGGGERMGGLVLNRQVDKVNEWVGMKFNPGDRGVVVERGGWRGWGELVLDKQVNGVRGWRGGVGQCSMGKLIG